MDNTANDNSVIKTVKTPQNNKSLVTNHNDSNDSNIRKVVTSLSPLPAITRNTNVKIVKEKKMLSNNNVIPVKQNIKDLDSSNLDEHDTNIHHKRNSMTKISNIQLDIENINSKYKPSDMSHNTHKYEWMTDTDEMATPSSTRLIKNIDSNKSSVEVATKSDFKISDGIMFLFRVYDNKSILRFDIENRSFKTIEFADFGNFEENYNSQGSISLNTVNGLFIVTGSNHDILYYFNYKATTMVKLGNLNDNHTFGSLIYYEKENQLICLSGWHNKKVERYQNNDLLQSYISSKNRKSYYENNSLKNHWTYLPEMRMERGECPYLILNETELYAFFGFNCPRAVYNNTIEKLDMSNPVQWQDIKFKNDLHLTTSIKSHSCILIDNSVFFLGGYDGQNEKPVEEFYVYEVSGKVYKTFERKYPDIVYNHFYNFQNDSAMVPFIDVKNRLHFAGFDENDQVHSIDTTIFNYDIFKFD